MIGHRLVVVGDAHLGAAPRADEDALIALLDAVPTLGDALLVTGDLYDFWFSYRRVIPRHAARVTAALITLARRLPVLMIGGNHDRWGGGFWEETGIRFAPHRLPFEAAGRRVLAVHGDGMHPERLSASLLNTLINSRPLIAAFRHVPPGIGFRVADALGHDPAFARAHPEVVEAAARRQRAIAERLLGDDPAIGALIMGHTHREAAEELAPGRWYLNPGAWLDGHRYALLDATGARLARFS